LIEVELHDLKKVGKEIADELRQRTKIDVSVKGGTLILKETQNGPKVNAKDAKLQLKHVLHHLGFSEEYRVLTEQHKIRIQKVDLKSKHGGGKEGTTPPPAQSLPYFFPG
jgi:hypothetical protein